MPLTTRDISQRGLNDLIDNFDYRSDQDAKATAVSERVSQLFNMHKFEIILFAIATIPLLPIAWPIGYAVLRNSAENDVSEALAKKQLKELSDATGPDLKNRSIALIKVLREPSGVPNDLLRYFKKSQIPLILYSLSNAYDYSNPITTPSSLDENYEFTVDPQAEIRALKAKFKKEFSQVERKRAEIKKEFHWSETQLNRHIQKHICDHFEAEEDKIEFLSNPSKIMEVLTHLHGHLRKVSEQIRTDEKEKNFRTVARGIKETVKDLVPECTYSHILGTIEENHKRDFVLSSAGSTLSLPLFDTLIADAKRALKFVIKSPQSTTDRPQIVHIKNGSDLEIERKLLPVINFFHELASGISDDEEKETLWNILHLTLTQVFSMGMSPITATPLWENGFKKVSLDSKSFKESNKPEYYTEYEFDPKNSKLFIICHQRNYIQDMNTDELLNQCLYSKVRLTIDLKQLKQIQLKKSDKDQSTPTFGTFEICEITAKPVYEPIAQFQELDSAVSKLTSTADSNPSTSDSEDGSDGVETL